MARESKNIANAITTVNEIISAQSTSLGTIKEVLVNKGATDITVTPDEERTPLESNTDTITEILDMTESLPEGGTTDGYVGGIGYGKKWVRPANFPNYDYVDRANEEALYFTYDCSCVKPMPSAFENQIQICFFIVCGSEYKVELGSIDINGFHATSEFILPSREIFESAFPTDTDFVVVRVTPYTDGTHIHNYSFAPKTSGAYLNYTTTKCVEIWGSIPYATEISQSAAFDYRLPFCLESIDLITSDTLSCNATFQGGTHLKNIQLSSKSGKIISTGSANQFLGSCTALTNIDFLSNLEIGSTTVLSNAFRSCTSLLNVEQISHWNVENVTNISYMFSYMNALVTLDYLSAWSPKNLKVLSGFVRFCKNLLDVEFLKEWNISNDNVDLSAAFAECSNLKKIDISHWYSKVISIDYLVYSCTSLEYLDISNLDISGLSNIHNNTFALCPNLTDFYPCKFYISVNLSSSSLLSDDSIERVIEALQPIESAQTLKLHEDVKAKLTEDQLTRATEKGWTIA